ncbi:hypothetical protein AA310_05740 [Arthrobacter sp. YC-RL1]|uniref:tyrosine-type recombinase/integrase n=1 Tax=Arthrobacter sp. YC-RL1 TaxID=1652545 RepID=UPI00063D9B51|nr:site-specific integrase [Arthrobacter sp. YC-RL1]ALQ31235.1 hypothetical protein ATC04_12145 [Arthrobacter sp. YC-RL1]KLI87509.1 hypothetical protein AA310_05740 [Arthrobacter sp. YC-RL1]
MGTGRINDLWHTKDKTPTSRYGIGKRWQAIWSDGHGNVTKRSFLQKDGAKAWIDTQIYESTRNPYTLRKDVPFATYWKTWRDKQTHQRAGSLKSLDAQGRNWILPAFEGKYIQKITREDVQAAVNEWAGQLAPSTVKLTLTYLRQVFNDAVYCKQVNESPCLKIKLPEQFEQSETGLTDEVLGELLAVLPAPFDTAARLGAATGLRPGELIGLRKQDINFRTGHINLRVQDASTSRSNIKTGPLKTRYSVRNIKFGPKAAELLRGLCASAGRHGRLFHSAGEPLLRNHFQVAWKNAREHVQEIGPGWHQLRHYHASALISKGFSPVAVAARLGHKDANETLRTYAHMWFGDDDRLAEVSEELFSFPEAGA